MKQLISFILTLLALFFFVTQIAWAKELVGEHSAELISPVTIYPKVSDDRISKLELYFESQNSPLAAYAKVFIDKADEYDLPDWRLVPAITGVESTFGKAIPYNSFNAYGWANGAYSFKNWEESIDVVTKTLKDKYIARGLTTPETIAPVYAPPSTTWAGKVRFFMQKIDSFTVEKSATLSLTF